MTRLRTPLPPSWGAEHAMLAKAARGPQRPAQGQAKALPPAEDPRGIQRDFFELFSFEGTGFIEKRDPYGVALSPEALRALSRNFVAAAVIERLVSYAVEFGTQQQHPYGLGFQVRLREHDKSPTRIETKKIAEISDEVARCGVLRNEDELFYRDSFRTYVRKIAHDSLVLDRTLTEFVPDRAGQPAMFHALDGGTARFAIDEKTGYRYPVQVGRLHTAALAEWKPGDPHRAHIGIRRSYSMMEYNGYGRSELEDAIAVLFGLHKGAEHNFTFFDKGITGAGILSIPQKSGNDVIRAAGRYLRETMTGSKNNRRIGLMAHPPGEKPEFMPLSQVSMKDMEFGAFMNFLLKVFCALYKIDPILIGFQFGNEGQSSSLAQGSGRDRIEYAKVSGLWPLARHIIGSIDRYYVRPKFEDFEIIPAGLDVETEEERNARDKEAMENWASTNEIRAQRDKKDVDLTKIDNLADVPGALKSQWVQLQLAKAPEGAEEGAEGLDEEPERGAPVRPSKEAEGLDLERFMDEARKETETNKSLAWWMARSMQTGAPMQWQP